MAVSDTPQTSRPQSDDLVPSTAGSIGVVSGLRAFERIDVSGRRLDAGVDEIGSDAERLDHAQRLENPAPLPRERS